VLKITPSNINMLMVAGDPKQILPRKVLIVGGEVCSWDLVRRVYGSGRCAMINHYGPTEATVGCLVYEIAKRDDPAEGLAATVPLGRPLPNVQVYVLDSELRLVPSGVAGEICISGAGIASGYIGRPDETMQRFVPHPFVSDGSLLYRTGDLGRYLADGSIEFLGRADDQVKIRGHRVELAEIEAVLSEYEGVQQAAVLLCEGSTGQRLVAYLTVDPIPPAGALEDRLRQRLPEYMVPGEIVIVTQFPLNANGKVDRRKLAEWRVTAVKPLKETSAPRNEAEALLVGIWKEVLHLDNIGVADNFFELGGHSLLATLVASRIRSAFDVQIPIRTLFDAPTVESLALAIESALSGESEDDEMADLLSQLEGLSDQETRRILEGEPGSPGSTSASADQA
jgi:acyl carrier protein